MVMKTVFDESWQQWIRTNVDAGQDKDGIFKILLDEGYDYQAIKQQMNYEPSIPVVLLQNPFKIAEQKTRQQRIQSQNQSLSKLFIPGAKSFGTADIELYSVEDFLLPQECQALIELIEQAKQPSTITSENPDQQFRTSSTCHLGNMQDPVIRKIDLQICQYLGIDPSYSEVIQGQHYQLGQQFKPHTDYFEPYELAHYGGIQGQRTYTFMIYLNEVEQGGDTVFPELAIGFKAKKGMAVIWNNINPDGSVNYQTLHQGMPVQKGEKLIITKWFRQHSLEQSSGPMLCKEINEYVPAYNKVGFVKERLPDWLFKQIVEFYKLNKALQVDEHIPGDFVYNINQGQKSSSLIELPEHLRETLHDTLKPMMEAWCGKTLEPTFVYGIRVYKNQAMLKLHRDRYQTHIISAIINVAQDVNQDWPLLIDDNYYRQHQVNLQPGEMLFYESARLKHGRPLPLDGRCYANIFCHFKPLDYQPELLKKL
ncbi:prolyl hydroxylase family protein [Paraglaciecola arctica]|uniref:Prolyl 4-hydroxylase n=1 Tax=Paraglaciecola arctica BSs20135 TaxID=493475 RepID=K6YTX6_9ALTE|nr:2OG-Fe(II) oxygenase [Paraglaciecola arctica]GAC20168.1 prolyl 4-hydroxylase [Paraglaciecola arctica BSs20135]